MPQFPTGKSAIPSPLKASFGELLEEEAKEALKWNCSEQRGAQQYFLGEAALHSRVQYQLRPWALKREGGDTQSLTIRRLIQSSSLVGCRGALYG